MEDLQNRLTKPIPVQTIGELPNLIKDIEEFLKYNNNNKLQQDLVSLRETYKKAQRLERYFNGFVFFITTLLGVAGVGIYKLSLFITERLY